MRFEVLPVKQRAPNEGEDVGYLLSDAWNDWFKYQTQFYLVVFDGVGEKHEVGSVKIGQFDWREDQSSPDVPTEFDELDNRFFSLGQDPDFYSTIYALGEQTASTILTALRDIAADEELYNRAIEEDVTGVSLLRHVNESTVRGQFRRILGGGAALTPYAIRYQGPKPKLAEAPTLELSFDVRPDSTPPTNIHVLVGRNGVGKTFLLNSMARALVSPDSEPKRDGEFSVSDDIFGLIPEVPFANIVSVTFSAFDDFQIIRQSKNATKGIRYTNVGLRKRVKTSKDEWATITRDPEDLATAFSDSAKPCIRGAKGERWKRALTTLEADPLFAEAMVASLAEEDESNFGRAAGKLYRKLSSGHKIVLLTITKLVECVEERTLVLMDEPEAHLHPPLLSAFIRSLSDLLINRNGVAIIATHSPVVLQEVPRSCVWKVVRHGHVSQAQRPDIETFAENVGILTREVFGLEVTRSGFHKMLADAVSEHGEADEVLDAFEGEIGADGRALISAMLATRRLSE